MKQVRSTVLTVICLVCAPLIARAERLEAVWIGSDGSGREGDWNTPSHWNLGVVPYNGADGNGDGIPDVFDVWIDRLPPATAVHNDVTTIDVAGLNLGEDDMLDLQWPGNLVLRDVDSIAEIVNHGVIRLGGIHVVEPRLSFAGQTLRFSGNGVVDIGTQTARPAILAGLDNGRIINGPGHTLRTAGRLYGGRISGFMGNETNGSLALTNEGAITVAELGANLSIRLNGDNHFNSGVIEAVDGGDLTFLSVQNGLLANSGLVNAKNLSDIKFIGLSLTNDAAGVMRAETEANIEFHVNPVQRFENRGLIEAVGSGSAIIMVGKQLDNRDGGVVRARSGGEILLFDGTFRPDPAIQIVDQASFLGIYNAVFENEGNVLSAGPGTLVVDGRGPQRALVRGGEITSGEGKLRLSYALLDDLKLSGTAAEFNVDLKGMITVDSDFTANDVFSINLSRGDAVLRGSGVSRFTGPGSFDAGNFTLEIAADHRVETSSLGLHGTVLVNGQLDAGSLDVEGVLGGDGLVSSITQIVVRGSAVISPGNGIGTLSLDGDVHFNAGGLIAELGDGNSDLLSITGNLFLNFDETLLLSGGLAGQSYVIAEFTGQRSGEFDHVTPGYNLIYDDLTKQIRVEPIPEPSSLALAIFGMMGAGWASWRNRGQRAA
jgi:hypothetical protein